MNCEIKGNSRAIVCVSRVFEVNFRLQVISLFPASVLAAMAAMAASVSSVASMYSHQICISRVEAPVAAALCSLRFRQEQLLPLTSFGGNQVQRSCTSWWVCMRGCGHASLPSAWSFFGLACIVLSVISLIHNVVSLQCGYSGSFR